MSSQQPQPEQAMLTVQDKIDAAVEATSGGDNRTTVTVLVWRHHHTDEWRFEVVGTEERQMWAVATSEREADQKDTVELFRRREDAYSKARDHNGSLVVRGGHKTAKPVRVYERIIWSELDEAKEYLSHYHTVTVTVPLLIHGTPSDWERMVADTVKEEYPELFADGEESP